MIDVNDILIPLSNKHEKVIPIASPIIRHNMNNTNRFMLIRGKNRENRIFPRK